MKRADVYRLIDSERAYQDKRWGQVNNVDPRAGLTGSSTLGAGVGNRSIDEFALYVEGYARDLTQLASHTNDPAPKLDFFRKVAALCVAAMEQHGGKPRE